MKLGLKILALLFGLLPQLASAQVGAPGGMVIQNTSGSNWTNQPISITTPFRQGDIPNCVAVWWGVEGGNMAPITSYGPYVTQTDAKNRYSDGSLKFGTFSFVIPALAAGQKGYIAKDNQASCNNTGFLTQAQMLATTGAPPGNSQNWNFDGTVITVPAANKVVSARAMLSAATSIVTPTNGDIDTALATAGTTCVYWLQGPVVTSVVCADRINRAFDFNVDGGTGNPLHPEFEMRFYPQTGQVQLGYIIENGWASASATMGTSTVGARNQTYQLTLKAGLSAPATVFTNTSFLHNTRARVHEEFCINQGTGPGAFGTAYDCMGAAAHIDHSYGYLAATKFFPNWDPNLQLAPSLITSMYNSLFTTVGTDFNGCASCASGGPQVGGYAKATNSTGADPQHGPLPTWQIVYLMSQCDAGNSTAAICGNGAAGDMHSLMLKNADLGGLLPYFYREADASAGHGLFFDAPHNTIATQGRVISINARTQFNAQTATFQGPCNTNFAADWVNFGTGGESLNGFQGTDPSHWPNIAYAAYLTTGSYAYYEAQLMQTAYAIALAGDTGGGGSRSCTQNTNNSALRMANFGYWENGQERGTAWQAREHALGTFLCIDGAAECAYFLDKLRVNLATWEGLHNIPCDIPDPGGNAIPYCTGTNNAWTYGNTVRIVNQNSAPTPLGSWVIGAYSDQGPLNVPWVQGVYTCGDQITDPGFHLQQVTGFPAPCSNQGNIATGASQPTFNDASGGTTADGNVVWTEKGLAQCAPSCLFPSRALVNGQLTPVGNSNFQSGYSGIVLGWINDLGFCPGSCAYLDFISNFYLNEALNPVIPSNPAGYNLAQYIYPTLDGSLVPINNWPQTIRYYATPVPPSWAPCVTSGGADEWYLGIQNSVMSYLTNRTSSQGGFSGSTAYQTVRQGVNLCQINFAIASPKDDIVPRVLQPFVLGTTAVSTLAPPTNLKAVPINHP